MANTMYPNGENFRDIFAINQWQFHELNMTKAKAGRSAHQKSEDMGSDRQLDHVVKEDLTSYRGEHI